MAKKKKGPQLPYKYRGLVLDEFQRQGIWYLQQNISTLICAPTGTGKTLIADYLADKSLQEGKRLIYTGPIKALVNQKYREFARLWGRGAVGILTGDITINPQAPIVVMTAEVFRNILLREPERLAATPWVIFDEIHYLDHPHRGTVWEESILLLPRHMHLLGLSATIPNAEEIGRWMERALGQPTAVLIHTDRAVPLKHYYYNKACRLIPQEDLYSSYANVLLEKDERFDLKGGTMDPHEFLRGRRLPIYRDQTRYLDLIDQVASQRGFPCLYFAFSRQGCARMAADLATRRDYLAPKEKEIVRLSVRRKLRELGLEPEELPGFEDHREQWERGIAVHHAGLLPALKGIVEFLLERRLIKVIFATETFAVGVNMPVRTVCFHELQKFDGQDIRPLTQGEYFQMAGRAGRRGLDRQGTVISLVDFSKLDKTRPPTWDEGKLEPITSRMDLSWNMVINLASRFHDGEVEELFAGSLASFQGQPPELLCDQYRQKKETLENMAYLQGEEILPKGQFCRGIYVHELLVTELYASGFLASLAASDLCALTGILLHNPRPQEELPFQAPPRWLGEVEATMAKLARWTAGTQAGLHPAVAPLLIKWSQGVGIIKLLRDYPLDPGDFVALCRQCIDLLRQIGSSVPPGDPLEERTEEAIALLDRGVVQVKF
ncbi:MAG: DEAD/DEAH box helicase [Limnochordia bacterium]|jgi:superfamily II RNA helicase